MSLQNPARREPVVPRTFSEAAAALAGAAAQRRPVRFVGGGSKLDWGCPTAPGALRIHTGELNRVIVHPERATATISAGTPLARVQATLARGGMMLALDPPLGRRGQRSATIGGVVAAADAGPLSHRYGPPGAQLEGVTVALSDGTILSTGPRGGYTQDGHNLTRLTAGSFGTLGLILELEVRLEPLPFGTFTALASSDDPAKLLGGATALALEHTDLQALDYAWRDGRGGLLAQLAGEHAAERAAQVVSTLRSCGLDDASVRADDASLWARQRAGQRAPDPSLERSGGLALLRVAHHPDELGAIIRLADTAGATAVGRAARGVSYLTLTADQIAPVRAALPEGSSGVALDLPLAQRSEIDPWAFAGSPHAALMQAVRARFDPHGICNPGLFDWGG